MPNTTVPADAIGLLVPNFSGLQTGALLGLYKALSAAQLVLAPAICRALVAIRVLLRSLISLLSTWMNYSGGSHSKSVKPCPATTMRGNALRW